LIGVYRHQTDGDEMQEAEHWTLTMNNVTL